MDSGPWPCDYAGAGAVKLKPRDEPPPPPPPPPIGVLVAAAYLKTGEVQDFADQVGALGSLAVGYDLKFQVRVEVGSDGKRPPDDVVDRLNERLGEFSASLKFARGS